MIRKDYSINKEKVTQTLTTEIEADRKTVFKYLATTEGISAWFPQLTLSKEDDEQLVLFDMGDGTYEKMALLDYKTDEHISYEWASGKVSFTLEDTVSGTKLQLKEELPKDFPAIPEDFTGWYVQMTNVKSVSETGKVAKLDKEHIHSVKEAIRSELKAPY